MDDGLRGDGLIDGHGRFSVGREDRFARAIELGHLDRVRLERLRDRVRAEILDHALRHEDEGKDDTERNQEVVGAADQVGPKIADGLGALTGDPAHKGGGDAKADGGRREVVDRQTDHLREIRHRRFAGVALPIGVGGETRGGVEREGGRQAGEMLRIQREQVLEAQDKIGEQHPDEAEGQQCNRVGQPRLFFGGIDATDPIREPLDGTHGAVEPRPTVRIEHLHQVKTEGLGEQKERAEEQRELEPGVGRVHLEFLRSQHGEEQVDEEGEGDEADDEVFHGRKCRAEGDAERGISAGVRTRPRRSRRWRRRGP